MKTMKQYFPENLPAAKSSAMPKSQRTTPVADIDFLSVAEKVSDTWMANPQITLIWKTSNAFQDEVKAYRDLLQDTRSSASQRPAQTNVLYTLDKDINIAVNEVKVYIRKKWKTAAEANYYRFGIVKESGNYRLPKDRDERRNALQLMIDAIKEDGFSTEEYGLAFWNAILANYTAALDVSNRTDGVVSSSSGAKNQMKSQVKKVLTALRLCLRANYPDTYRQIIRQWGWQKEDY